MVVEVVVEEVVEQAAFVRRLALSAWRLLTRLERAALIPLVLAELLVCSASLGSAHLASAEVQVRLVVQLLPPPLPPPPPDVLLSVLATLLK